MNRFRSLQFSCFILLLGLLSAESLPLRAQNVNVLTWQDNTHRTGYNAHESNLLYNTLNKSNFGQLCAQQLDGQVYAQPLVVTNVTFTGYSQPQTVVYVVTENDTVYAISGSTSNTAPACTILGSPLSLSQFLGQYPADCNYLGAAKCTSVAPNVGILGTPVINSGKLYVVAETQNQPLGSGNQPTAWAHTLFAIDISTLAVASHVVVTPPSGCLYGSQPFSLTHIQRPGLLFATVGSSKYVYVAFSMMDGNAPLPNGMVLGYNVASFSSTPLCFATTSGPGALVNSGGGGIWQDGAGLAYGSDGTGSYIYFNTGNGEWDGTSNFADSFVKLDPGTLSETDYFTPSDQYYRNCVTNERNVDLDFGSGGVLLVPDQELSNQKYLAISADKEGSLWVMNRSNPGKWNQGTCSVSGSCVPCTAANGQAPNNQNVQTVQVLTNGKSAYFRSTPAFASFNVGGTITSYIYTAAIGGFLTQNQLCNSSTAPICNTPVTTQTGFRNGVTPAVSSNSSSQTAADGILWAIWGDASVEPLSSSQRGVLFAYDAVTMKPLYASNQCSTGVDQINVATKFSVPTIANGYVYVGTMGPMGGISGSYNNGAFYIFTTVSRTSC
jgi:hypothetical protein